MRNLYYLIFIALLFQRCIGTDIVDDYVEARVTINNPIRSLKVNSTYQFKATYLNNVGSPENAAFEWKSSNMNVVKIDNEGNAFGLEEGESTIITSANGVSDSLVLFISDTTINIPNERVANLKTVSTYPLSGNATLKKSGGKIVLEFDESFTTTSALPGLYVYLTNNVSTINNALEVAKVKDFSGAQSYEVSEDISLNTYDYVLFYCKPFLVPVGNGELKP